MTHRFRSSKCEITGPVYNEFGIEIQCRVWIRCEDGACFTVYRDELIPLAR